VASALAATREGHPLRHGPIELSDEHLAAAAAGHAGHIVLVDDRAGRLLVPAIAAYLCVVFGERVQVMTVNDS
jgi:hypothetical protein